MKVGLAGWGGGGITTGLLQTFDNAREEVGAPTADFGWWVMQTSLVQKSHLKQSHALAWHTEPHNFDTFFMWMYVSNVLRQFTLCAPFYTVHVYRSFSTNLKCYVWCLFTVIHTFNFSDKSILLNWTGSINSKHTSYSILVHVLSENIWILSSLNKAFSFDCGIKHLCPCVFFYLLCRNLM